MVVEEGLKAFWTSAHERSDGRWVTGTAPEVVLTRLGVDLTGVESALEIGPGCGHLAEHLREMGKRVVVHDIVPLDVPGFVADLPLSEKVDVAIANLVIQHVFDHERLIRAVLESLVPRGTFYFDVVTRNYTLAGIAEEFASGKSFPFAAWDLVTESNELAPGWFACVARNSA